MFITLTLKYAVTLFALVDPILLVPLFLKLTSAFSANERSAFTTKVALMVGGVLVAAALVGRQLFEFLGLSLGALQVTGGFVLFSMGIAMLLGQELAVKGHGTETEQETAKVVPLAIPLLAGPASLSFVMTQHNSYGPWSMLIACVSVALLVWLTFRFAAEIGKRVTASHLAIVERLAGLLVTVMAVELFAKGVKALFPALAQVS